MASRAVSVSRRGEISDGEISVVRSAMARGPEQREREMWTERHARTERATRTERARDVDGERKQ